MKVSYTRPPVTEAVIDLQFAQPLPMSVIDKAQSRFRDKYPSVRENKNYNLRLDIEAGKARADANAFGYRMATRDELDIRIVNVGNFTLSRLAPYPGWSSFSENAQNDLDAWYKIAPVTRTYRHIGVRYINRIDIADPQGKVELDDYFNFSIITPKPTFHKMFGFSVNAKIELGESADEYCIASASLSRVDSPRLGHTSILLDLDVFRQNIRGEKAAQIWDIVELLHKNVGLMFESSITDRTRKLLNDA